MTRNRCASAPIWSSHIARRGAERVGEQENGGRRRAVRPGRRWPPPRVRPIGSQCAPVGVEGAVDEDVGGAEVAARLEQCVDLAPFVSSPATAGSSSSSSAKPRPDVAALAAAACTAAVAVGPPDRRCEGQDDPLGQEDAAGHPQVAGHRRRVDLEPDDASRRTCAATPPAARRRSVSVSHSACHPPTARSCSWTMRGRA